MLWVTFGYAETTGMTVVVEANVKDENYFAERRACRARSCHRRGSPAELGGKGGAWRAYLCERLLLGTGKSTVAQLPERHLAAHLLAIGLA
jgi:hypothetical protein